MLSELIYINKNDLFKELDSLQGGEFFAVADVKIKNHLPQSIQFSAQVFWLHEPEEDKTLTTYSEALEFFLRIGIQRSSTLYVFGGGATTDFGGFVAATIVRGIKWVAVPTTLLAMVDGSLGGKVALNMPAGKNLVGAFHQPTKIFLCSDFLATLNEENWQSGKGEILKYGFLSKDIYQLIISKQPIEKIIVACAQFKMGIVKKDFREEGDRILLNLGHTLGHAFESTLKIPHGIAVTMGMKYLFEILKKERALTAWEEMVKALSLPLEKMNIKTYSPFDKKKIFAYLQNDKKRIREKLKLIVAEAPGEFSVQEVAFTDFKSRINSHDDFAD